jgi:hypothetical protein
MFADEGVNGEPVGIAFLVDGQESFASDVVVNPEQTAPPPVPHAQVALWGATVLRAIGPIKRHSRGGQGWSSHLIQEKMWSWLTRARSTG